MWTSVTNTATKATVLRKAIVSNTLNPYSCNCNYTTITTTTTVTTTTTITTTSEGRA